MENLTKINNMVEIRRLKLLYHNKNNNINLQAADDAIFYFNENKYVNHIMHAYATIDFLDMLFFLYHKITGELLYQTISRVF